MHGIYTSFLAPKTCKNMQKHAKTAFIVFLTCGIPAPEDLVLGSDFGVTPDFVA